MSIPLLITAGMGPSECHQAVAGVLDRMRTEAALRGMSLDTSETPSKHGLKSVVVVIHGTGAEQFADSWTGTILWRSQSKLRQHHKRANWFIGVFALPWKAAETSNLHDADIVYESFRAGGPGGQHQNTTDSAVRAIHRPTGLVAVARDMRSQHRNKARAKTRLAELMMAQAAADADAARQTQNQLHMQLERGNPVRSFQGPDFKPMKGR